MARKNVVERTETAVPATTEETRTLTPPADIFETEKALVVVVDLPGVDKGDIDVGIADDVLTISGKVKKDVPGEAVYQEYELLDYSRQFRLDEEVDQENVRAEMERGVLTIELPKTEKARPKRIPVKVSA